MQKDGSEELYAGLSALAESTFPKKCATCNREFASLAQLILETNQVRQGISGLKQGNSDDGQVIVELFRNCVCGSTLMDSFSDRRRATDAGLLHRERFAQVMIQLERSGVSSSTARTELKKLLRGEGSQLIAAILRDQTRQMFDLLQHSENRPAKGPKAG